MAGQTGVMSQTAIREYRKDAFLISTDPSKLDVNAIHAFLSRQYWETEGIPKETVERSIRGSLCFGVYDGDQQVGFARAITDGATYAYLCDDYILESHRGRGLGKWLMECILSHPDLQGLRRWTVVTRDVRLYEKVGFRPLKDPKEYLEIVNLYRTGVASQS
jgi:GNAT superfamily N-acetyltransferase